MAHGGAHRACLYDKSDFYQSCGCSQIAAANSPVLNKWGRIGKMISRGDDILIGHGSKS